MSYDHELVLASAGSGKTYRISSRIITLLADEVAPHTIFASTFTRKAAGEILSRVLKRLADAAAGAEAAEALSEATGRALGPDGWRTVLARTVRSLHELDVSTLDAFFGRTLRAFAHDLGLPAGWRVADEPTVERVRARALEAVLDHGDRGTMVELVRGIRGGDVRWSVHGQLARDMDDILAVHRDLDPEGPGWRALAEALALDPDQALDPEADQRLRQEFAAALAEAPLASKADGTPNGHWVKARQRLTEKLAGGDWLTVATDGFLAAGASGSGQYYRKDYPPELQSVLVRIREAAREAVGRRLIQRAAATERLAERYEEALTAELMASGTLSFDDVTRFLSSSAPVSGRDDLGYRLDGRIRHLLLDEFQDTSLQQWKAMRPLTDRIFRADAGADRSAAVVADPKQSIYGWRGAAPVIVDALAERYRPVEDTLHRSWRSSRPVLDAVNRVFDGVEDSPVFEDSPEDRETVARWLERFTPHTPARGDRPGYVALEVGPPRVDGKALQPELLRWTARRVKALHEAAPDRSIGILVGRRAILARLLFELQQVGIRASEEGGTPLLDSPAVVSLLALLRLAEHPGNALARYHVAATPLGEALEYEDPTSAPATHALARRVRRRLLEDGYGATLARLRDRIAPDCDDRDLRRLGQLVALGYAHDDNATLRIDDFIRLAEAHRVEAGGEAAVRVMTVWGAKGLEFDTVVLPDLDRTMIQVGGGRSTPPLAYRPTPTRPVSHAFPYLNQELRDLFGPVVPELQRAYEQTRASQARDALSGLYVAMTRARHALHLVIPATSDQSPKSPAMLLRHRLDPDPEADTAQDEIRYARGQERWWEGLAPGTAREAGTGAPPVPRIRLARSGPRTRLLERRTPSSHAVELEQLLGLAGRDATGVPATVRGSVAHAWMEAVTWLESGLPDRDTRLALARREVPALDDVTSRSADDPGGEAWLDELWAWLGGRLQAPEIRDALTRSTALADTAAELGDVRREQDSDSAGPAAEAASSASAPLTLEVENELPFLHREGDTLMEGIIDRLVLVREGEAGPVLAAHVLDYKTDAVPAGDEAALQARVQLYAPQLRAYRGAVSALYDVPAQRVRLSLLFLEPGRAVAIP